MEMGYGAFKEAVLEGLKEICGDSAQIRTEKILKNNGKHYDGIRIIVDGADRELCPVLPLQWFHGAYCDGDMSMAGCIRTIYETCRECSDMGDIARMVRRIMDWDWVKENIYPVLLPTGENWEMLEKVVSLPMLDLSVMYIYRRETGGRCAAIKIDRRMLDAYGISVEELHRQALENLAGDGYCFRDMLAFIMEWGDNGPLGQEGKGQTDNFYILTNTVMFYGAAGILDRELVRRFAAGRDFYIIPASVHETIFVPADGNRDVQSYNDMVKFVNETEVDTEDRLSDHVYLYDAGADEIRMCV